MEKMQKKKRRQLFGWLCLAAAVILLTAMPLIAGQKTAQEGPVATVISGTADTGTITVTLGGGGTLSEETSEKITLPDDIKIKEFLVKNGDSVQQGDPLAAVDPVSVMAAIAEIQETMDYLTTQIASAGESKGTTRLTAMTAGRVKEVYAQSGDDVQSVMLEHGALALLSLDGRMAVDIEKHTELSAGDAVEVAFPEGKSVAGRVESSLDGVLTVSLADKDYVIGQQVTVRTPEGDTLGTGSLYVHNAWKVTAYFGKVAKVNIKVNDKVTKGRLLFQLEETGHSTQAQVLNAERQEYEILMEKLFGIYETGLLTAPCDGIVGGVRTDSPWMLSAMETDLQNNLLENGTAGNGGWTVILLSAQMPEEKPEGGEEPAPAKSYLVISAVQVDAAVGGDVWKVRRKNINATVTDLSVLNVTVPKTAPTEELAIAGVKTAAGEPHAVQPGDILLYVEEGGSTYWLYLTNASGIHMGGFGNMAGLFGKKTEEPFEKYDLTETEVLTVTPARTMTLDITVDELDIRRIVPGQEVEVTVHALGDKTFTGLITRIGEAVNSGGNSKFSVRITMDREENMLAGMSASVTLKLETVENAVRIPVAALNGNGRETFVYTGYDEKSGMPERPVHVELGASDGEYVQILSGLEAGDPFWYAYYEARESDILQ